MAINESWVFDTLELNSLTASSTTYHLESVDTPVPAKRFEWASGADAEGAALVRDPLVENREITFRLRADERSTMDLALAAIGQIVDKIEEAEKQLNGLPLVWTPADATKSLTFRVLTGSINGMPISATGDDAGWFIKMPVMTIVLICKPYGYGTETSTSLGTSTLPVLTGTLASVLGDVPAEGRLLVVDNSTQNRRFVEWGLEQRYYNAATSNILDSDSIVTSGFAGTGTTRTGAYDPGGAGNSVVRASMYNYPVAVCGTGVLAHVGVFRVKARVWASSASVRVRLAWQEGDGPFSRNPYAIPPTYGSFCEVDLGLISVPEKTLGTQKWTGTIEAFGADSGDTIDVDYLIFMPAGEGYGFASAPYQREPGVAVIQDAFSGTTTGGNLNARVAPLGGTWATSGATTDFTFFDLPTPYETVRRQTIGDTSRGRLAVLGSAKTNVDIACIVQFSGDVAKGGVIARWVDANNYVFALLERQQFVLGTVVAGTETTLKAIPFARPPDVWHRVRLVAFTSGRAIATVETTESRFGAVLASVESVSSVLATGGALASGTQGLRDQSDGSVAATRYYTDVFVSTPPAEPIALHSTRSIEFRHDETIRVDSTNTYWGPAPAYRGSRFLIPPAGSAARTTRIAVKAHRNDITVNEDSTLGDSITATAYVTPRYLAVPR